MGSQQGKALTDTMLESAEGVAARHNAAAPPSGSRLPRSSQVLRASAALAVRRRLEPLRTLWLEGRACVQLAGGGSFFGVATEGRVLDCVGRKWHPAVSR